MPIEESLSDIVGVFRNHGERPVPIAEPSEEELASELFNEVVESDILPLFHQTAELLKDSCTVQIHRQEHTAERPFVVNVAMVITPNENGNIRQLLQPYAKLDFCLRQKTLKMVIFTELPSLAKLQIEEIDFDELTPEKLEQYVLNFVVEILR